jgi:CRISPR-associated protein Cmr6
VRTLADAGLSRQCPRRCERTGPNDYDSPTPVGFISVKPGAKLLLAVGGQAEWAKLALRLLTEAIHEWGAGGKTSAGYGRS